MKKYTRSFNKYNHLSNNLKLKSILSILTMGLFIFFGFASLDEDPASKILDDCEFLHPPVAVGQKCLFNVFDAETHMPPVNLDLIINFQIKEYEKVDDLTQCTLMLKNSYTKTLHFGSSGKASFILSKSYVSNDDEIEIYYLPSMDGYDKVPYIERLHKSYTGIDDHQIPLYKTIKNP